MVIKSKKNLDASQFTVHCSDENSYVLFNSWNSKTFNGGLDHRRFVPRSIKQFDTGVENCVFKIFKLYLSMIPAEGPFYRKPLSSVFAFGSQNVGLNTLSVYTKTMFEECGIDTGGRRIVNHSGRVTCCTRLYNDGFDEQSVTGRSGHRSKAVQIYKRRCLEQEKAVSSAFDVSNISNSVGGCVAKREETDKRCGVDARSTSTSESDNNTILFAYCFACRR